MRSVTRVVEGPASICVTPKTKAPKTKAGTVLPLGYKVEWIRKNDDHKRKRNTFMCLHYDRVKRKLVKTHPKAHTDDKKRTMSHWHEVAGAT